MWRLDEDIGEDDWVNSESQTFGHGLKLAAADIKMWILVSQSVYLPAILDCGWLSNTPIDGDAVLHCGLWIYHKLLPHCCCDSGLR